MNDSLIIIGASGFGKEVAWLARRLKINIIGFLDDDNLLQGNSFCGYPVLGKLSDWIKYSEVNFSLAIASPRTRKIIVSKMHKQGVPKFITLVDPSVIIEDEINDIGIGSIICAGSICTANVKIGNYSIINKQCSIAHDVVIKDFCTIAPQVMLGGHVKVLNGAEIGGSSSIRQQLIIGEGASVGMGSVVVKDVESNFLYLGVPAKKIKALNFF
jgi:sugar O-acyltransferase (sialic acid O-acetyltransferase NeuD family)